MGYKSSLRTNFLITTHIRFTPTVIPHWRGNTLIHSLLSSEMHVSRIVYLALCSAGAVIAGFNAASKSNVAIYWGQNSVGKIDSQDRLLNYWCVYTGT